MLTELSLMISAHGVMTFDHAAYTRMANDTKHKVVGYDISGLEVLFPSDEVAIATYRVHQKTEMDGKPMEMDVVDSSTWVKRRTTHRRPKKLSRAHFPNTDWHLSGSGPISLSLRPFHLAVDHPAHAEAVHAHAEAFRPEGLLQRHGDLAAFG